MIACSGAWVCVCVCVWASFSEIHMHIKMHIYAWCVVHKSASSNQPIINKLCFLLIRNISLDTYTKQKERNKNAWKFFRYLDHWYYNTPYQTSMNAVLRVNITFALSISYSPFITIIVSVFFFWWILGE